MQVAVIGAGYVGLVTGVGLARLGHRVVVGEADAERLELLRDGYVPFFEPELGPTLRTVLEAGSITFEACNTAASRDAEVIFIAVPTPSASNGHADVSSVDSVIDDVMPSLRRGATIALKSTVPVGTTRRLQTRLRAAGIEATVVANPEFLQAGRAMADFFNPSRIVIGSDDPVAAHKVQSLYSLVDAPNLITDPVSAELIKYGSNAYLATRLSFVNELADLSGAVGADAGTVLAGLGHDPRIGPSFLVPGPGFGGSCLPKDSKALVKTAEMAGVSFRTVETALAVNAGQRRRNLERVRQALGGPEAGKIVALWGLAFKAGTDDVRDSPAMWLVEDLHSLGVEIRAFDELARVEDNRIERFSDPLEAAKGADVLVVTTEWDGFRHADFRAVGRAMRGSAVVDLRRVLDAAVVRRSGLELFDLRELNGNGHIGSQRSGADDRRSA